jgi:5'-deoxynucleotidase YfbR-like HD superfamily hydrolase
MGLEGPESIADHMYRMGLMAMIVDAPGIDVNK